MPIGKSIMQGMQNIHHHSIQKRQAFVILAVIVLSLACSILDFPPQNMEIFADQGWQSTGIQIDAGQNIEIEYLSGQIMDQTSTKYAAEGTDYICGHTGCCEPMPYERRSSLIGRVDNELFHIGNGGVFLINSSGMLQLRINDCDGGLFDNSGSLKVRIDP